MGKTVIIATNRLDDVSKVCNTDSQRENFIGILDSGKFAVFKRFSELQGEVTETNGADSLSPDWFNELLA